VFPQASLDLRIGLTKADVFRLLVKPRALSFDSATCRTEIEHILDAGAGERKLAVVSSEELCANPHGGAHLEKELADRLADTLPGARVLIVVREQRAMLASTYKQYIRAGASHPLDLYLNPPSLGDTRAGLPDWRHFRYHALIRYYRERFGVDRVLVIPYELLRTRPEVAINRLFEFCGRVPSTKAIEALPYGRSANVSLTALGTGLKRKLNRYVSRVDRLNPDPWVAISTKQHRRLMASIRMLEKRLPNALIQKYESRMLEVIDQWMGDRFKDSNLATQEWVEDDLSEFGYDL
jgi:hypothetical protein